MTNFSTLAKKAFLFPLLILFLIHLQAQTPFTDVTVDVGITQPFPLDFLPVKHDGGNGLPPPDPGPEDNMLLGTGAAWFDYNNDDRLDLYITMRDGANLLFENQGPGPGGYTFTEVAAAKGIQDASGDGSGVSVADYDNDGDKDIYICNTFVNRLYQNNGGPNYTFTDVTASAGLSTTIDSRSETASWADYDNDGYLDLYICNHLPHFDATNASMSDQLYHNDGDGTFTETTSLLDAQAISGPGFVGGWSDYNNDGKIDLILINDCNFNPTTYEKTKIFRNDGGTNGVTNWTFTEVSVSVGIDDCSNGMGIAIGDINHDQWLDFSHSDIGAIHLWKNDAGTFTNIANSAGVDGQVGGHYSWGTCFIDHNLDGWQDLFVVSGYLSPGNIPQDQPNYLYENDGDFDNDDTWDGTFSDVSTQMAMGDVERSRNGVFGDFDDDGDPDIALINYGQNVMIKQNNNDLNNANKYFKVKVLPKTMAQGGTHNLDGIGAKIKITTPDGDVQYAEIRSGSNLGGGDDIVAYFGIGSNSTVSTVEVTWPGETTVGDTWYDEPANSVLLAVEGQGGGPLPVELVNFEAKALQKEVLLEWETANEINNKHFNVQRSSDSRNFTTIGTLEGKGTSDTNNFYTMVDENPLSGDNYYRLEQVDVDGQSTFSQIELVRFENQVFAVQIAPNPVITNRFEVKITNPEQELQWEIRNIIGKVIKKDQIATTGNSTSFEIHTDNWAKGIYFVSVSNGINQQTKRVIVQ